MNIRRITAKIANVRTNLNLNRKWFSFIVIKKSWLTDEYNLVSEIDGYKYHTINRVCRTRGDNKLLHFYYVSSEVISNFSIVDESYESLFF